MIARLLAWVSAFQRRGAAGAIAVFSAVILLAAVIALFAVDRAAFLTSMDRYVQDWMISSLAPLQPIDNDVVVVAIDEAAISRYAYRSPINRGFLSTLLTSLAAKHPRAIGVDILFDQATEPANDAALRTTLRTLPVPLVVGYTDTPGVVDPSQLAFLNDFVPQKERAYVNLGTDQTDTVRWIFPGRVARDGRYMQSLSRALAARAGVASPDEQVPIIWHGSPSSSPDSRAFSEYSAAVAGILPAAWFQNKIILIGSDLALDDRHRTPFSEQRASEGMLPGVVIQAHAVAQILHRTPSPYLGWFEEFLITLALAAAGAGLGMVSLHIAPRVAGGIAFLTLFWVAGGLLYYYGDVMIGLIAPSIAAIAAFGAMDSLAGGDARRQREFIKGAMSRYLPSKYVEQLVDDPTKMSLEGERREMTFLFTDVKDFTTMSEGLESKELAPLLNAYLEGITQIVHQHEGMVDKFIGDAVFAIFNPPVIELPDHAERGVRCALAIDRFCQAFHEKQNREGIAFGITRIGVNSGAAVIGNFGSAEKFTYTAQGDAVNTASRLEGLNKHLGTRICVAEFDPEIVPDDPLPADRVGRAEGQDVGRRGLGAAQRRGSQRRFPGAVFLGFPRTRAGIAGRSGPVLCTRGRTARRSLCHASHRPAQAGRARRRHLDDREMMIWLSLAIIALLGLELVAAPEIHAHLSTANANLTIEVIVIALIVAISVLIDALIRRFYWRGYLKRSRGQETPALIQDLVTILLVVVGLSIGLTFVARVSVAGIAVASGGAAFVLGIALSGPIQDLFSGLAINFEGSYGIGDWLTIYTDQMPEPLYGCVSGITWRSTFLRLEDGRRLMVPNRLVTSNPVTNHSQPRESKRLAVTAVIDNRIPSDRVTDMLLGEAFKASRYPGLARHPEPRVLIKRLDSDSVEYEIRFHHHPNQISPTEANSIMFEAILDVIQANKIPTPVSQIELTKPPDLEFELGEEEERSLMARAPLFRDVLEPEHVDLLIKHSKPTELPVGTVLMAQGDSGSSMFIIMEGAANVTIRNDAGLSHEVNILATGDVVGEMSLMTGAMRNASVTALTEMRVLEISKEAIELLLEKAPDLAVRFSQVLAERQHQNADLAQRLSLRAAVQDDLLARIKTFFSRAFLG